MSTGPGVHRELHVQCRACSRTSPPPPICCHFDAGGTSWHVLFLVRYALSVIPEASSSSCVGAPQGTIWHAIPLLIQPPHCHSSSCAGAMPQALRRKLLTCHSSRLAQPEHSPGVSHGTRRAWQHQAVRTSRDGVDPCVRATSSAPLRSLRRSCWNGSEEVESKEELHICMVIGQTIFLSFYAMQDGDSATVAMIDGGSKWSVFGTSGIAINGQIAESANVSG